MKHNIYFVFSILNLVIVAPFSATNPLIALVSVGVSIVFYLVWCYKEVKMQEEQMKR